ncbi:MAG: nucleotidyltransferase domain-containing protein [Paracraurococcus sp.]
MVVTTARTLPDLPAALREAAARLASATRAEAVVLFGSRARGEARADSDWDLCVLLPDDTPAGSVTPTSLWRLVADVPLAIQVVPIRRSVFAARRGLVNSLSRDVAEDGVALHGALPP